MGDGFVQTAAAASGAVVAKMRYREKESFEFSTVAFSQDGRKLVTASGDLAIVWDARNGRRLAEHPHKGVEGAIFSPDGRRVATNSFDVPSELWSALDGHRIARLTEGGKEISQLQFGPGGARLAGTGGEGPAHVWDGRSGRHLLELRHVVSGDSDISFSNDRRWIATVIEGGARVWDLDTGRGGFDVIHRVHRADRAETPDVDAVAFSPDGRRLVTGARDGAAQLHECALCGTADDLLPLLPSRVSRRLTSSERELYLPR